MSPNTLDINNDNTYNLDAQNPYPGLHSFREKDKNYFFGRKNEIDEILSRIQKNVLTVVFGKSGIGKTSLIQAGIIPKLRENFYLPIYIQTRFDGNDKNSPREQVKAFIETKIKEVDKKAISIEDLTLWEYFHKVQIFGGLIKPLLMFDQFEEIFKMGKDTQKRINPLIIEIGDLVQDWMPVAVQEKFKNKSIPYPDKEPSYRVIFSLREDYLAQLMNLYQYMPSIVNGHYHYRVLQMRGKDAVKAVLEPGKEIIKDQKVVIEIVKKIPESKDTDYFPYEIQKDSWESKKIEPFLLSLFCYQVNEKRKELEVDKISSELVKDFTVEDIVKNYYEKTIKQFDPTIKIAIEDKLLTPEGERKLQDTNSIKKEYNIQEDDFEKLVDKRIIRKERRNNIDYVELIHDVLALILKEIREKRRAEKKLEEKNIKTVYKITSIVLIILLTLLMILFYQSIRVSEQYENVRELKVASEVLVELHKDNTRAVRIAQEAYKMGLHGPQEYTYQSLAVAGYSSFEKPFYITSVKHNGPIYTAVFSPDGNFILTASDDSTAKVWNLKGECVTNLNKHKERIMSAVFSSKDRYILTASWDKKAKLWDRQGRFKADLEHKGIVGSAMFSHDGTRIVTASRDGTAKLWDIEGILLKELNHNTSVASAVFSPDDKRILTASWDKTAKLWDWDGNLIKELKHESAVSSGVFSPDGKRILTASWDKKARMWDREGNLLKELEHNSAVTSVAFSPDSSQMLTATRDGITKLWDLEGKQIAKLDKHTDEIASAVFSPDGTRILTASSDKTTKLWDIDGNLLVDMKKFEGKVNSVVFSTDGRRFLTACEDGTATLWTLETPLLIELNKHKGDVNKAVFSPVSDDKWILTASGDHTAKLWDIKGNLLKTLNHSDVVTSAEFSPDGKKILTASWDRTVKLWDLERNTKAKPRVFKHNNFVSSAIFSPDGRLILTALVDGTVNLRDIEGNTLAELDKHTDMVTSAVFSPDGHRILTASIDGTVKLWNREGHFLEDMTFKGRVTTAVFSPRGDRILTACEDGTARVWTLEGSERLKLRHDGPVSYAEFSPNGRRIVTASEDGTAKLWNLKGNLLADLNKHKSAVTYAAFSPDDRQIVTASKDDTAKIWYTPESIYEWLEGSNIAKLSKEDK